MPSNSSKHGSSSKSPSSQVPDSQATSNVQLWLIPLLWGALSVIVQTHLCTREIAFVIWPFVIALVSALFITAAGITLFRSKTSPESPTFLDSKIGYVLLVIGGVAGFLGGVLFGLWTLAAAILVWAYSSIPERLAAFHCILLTILAASLFLGTALALGTFSLAAYPATFAFFFFLAWQTTRAVETFSADAKNGRLTIATLFGPRPALAVGGILFFLFGIITTWPFLNGLYSKVYFWIIILAVDFPMLWMWGKLRSRDKQLSIPAIARFNRVTRWLVFVVLISLLFA